MDALAAAGFDIVHAFDPRAIAHLPGLAALAPTGATIDERRALLIGNTRALWPVFLAARARDPGLAAARDPLERYTEATLDAAFPGARRFDGHRRYAGAFVPLQRVAIATGFGALAPSQLVVHPTFGPWFALRSVVFVAGEPPPPSAPVARACTCSEACPRALAAALADPGPAPWRAWLAVRDACCLRDHRYSDEQIRYHYTRAWPTPV